MQQFWPGDVKPYNLGSRDPQILVFLLQVQRAVQPQQRLTHLQPTAEPSHHLLGPSQPAIAFFFIFYINNKAKLLLLLVAADS